MFSKPYQSVSASRVEINESQVKKKGAEKRWTIVQVEWLLVYAEWSLVSAKNQ